MSATYMDKVWEAMRNPDEYDYAGTVFGTAEEAWKQFGVVLGNLRGGTLA
jgi:hypothetical protein